jgi:hypothetical protein
MEIFPNLETVVGGRWFQVSKEDDSKLPALPYWFIFKSYVLSIKATFVYHADVLIGLVSYIYYTYLMSILSIFSAKKYFLFL